MATTRFVLRARIPWTHRGTAAVRVPLTAHGQRLVRAVARPRLRLTLVARGPGGTSPAVQLPVGLR